MISVSHHNDYRGSCTGNRCLGKSGHHSLSFLARHWGLTTRGLLSPGFDALTSKYYLYCWHLWTLVAQVLYPLIKVRVLVQMQCQPLLEDQFRPVIADNYYEQRLYWIELDRSQTRNSISMFSLSPVDVSDPIPQNTTLHNTLINASPTFDAAHLVDDDDALVSKACSAHLNQSDVQLGHGMHPIQEVNTAFCSVDARITEVQSFHQRRPDNYEDVIVCPLSSVSSLVRFAEEPQMFAVEFNDGCPIQVYASTFWDSLLEAVRDMLQTEAGSMPCPVPVLPSASTHLKHLAASAKDAVAEGGSLPGSRTKLWRRIREFNACIPYNGVPGNIEVPEVTLMALITMLPAAPNHPPESPPLPPPSPKAAATVMGFVACLRRLLASRSAASHVMSFPSAVGRVMGLLRNGSEGVAAEAAGLIAVLIGGGPGNMNILTDKKGEWHATVMHTKSELYTTLKAMICEPHGETTQCTIFVELLRQVAGLRQRLFALSGHPAESVRETVSVIMRTIEEEDTIAAESMRDAALRGGTLSHAFFLPSGERHESASSRACCLPLSDGNPPENVQDISIQEGMSLSRRQKITSAEKRRFNSAQVPVTNSYGHKGDNLPNDLFATGAPQMGYSASVASPDAPSINTNKFVESNASNSVDSDPNLVAFQNAGIPTPAQIFVENTPSDLVGYFVIGRKFGELFSLDHNRADFIWNERTRQELRQALQAEVHNLDVEKEHTEDIVPGRATTEVMTEQDSVPQISWNYSEFPQTMMLKIGDLGLAQVFTQPIKKYTGELLTMRYRAPKVFGDSTLLSTSSSRHAPNDPNGHLDSISLLTQQGILMRFYLLYAPCDIFYVLAGDNESYNIRNIQEADVIVTTLEKFDAVTRYRIKDGGLSFFSDIAIVAIDEVHLLNDPRGAALEAIVSRIKMVTRNPEMKSCTLACVHFLVVSATTPNIVDLAEWLMVPFQGIKRFDEEMRPVKLTTKVFGYTPAKNDFLFEKGSIWNMIDQWYCRLSTGGRRTLFMDLDYDALKPEGWHTLADDKRALCSFCDISIYELHIRDFSERRFEDEFEPIVLSEKYMTEKDNHIRKEDIPERMQISEECTGPPPTNEMSIEEESNWIYNQLMICMISLLSKRGLGQLKGRIEMHVCCRTVYVGFNVSSASSKARLTLNQQLFESIRKSLKAAELKERLMMLTQSLTCTSPRALNCVGLRVVLDIVYNHLHGSGSFDENSVLDKVTG
ncbi:DNAJ heat shock N-terminal domain-containing protein [Actinidia rufa]|uniref:DNAJ heat shock N-terminal domain-containing protein n=1 Tax=Actinidia rufa TaxID=165716 RepID=A0A7J0ED49_9ERIC|nr:DNAJ heat shock N-terminal domain-containing protein [Actinidia rufa]